MANWNEMDVPWELLGADTSNASTTFLDLVNTTLRRLNEVQLKESTFATATGFHGSVKDAINAAILDINMSEFEWPFNRKDVDQVLEAGVAQYALPARTTRLHSKSFYLRRDESLDVEAATLDPITYAQYVQSYRDTDETGARGVPKAVMLTAGGSLLVTPVPDKAYVVSYGCWSYPADLVEATDITNIPTQFKHIIVEGALYHCHQFRQNVEGAQLSRQKFQQGLNQMRLVLVPKQQYVTDTRVSGNRSSVWF